MGLFVGHRLARDNAQLAELRLAGFCGGDIDSVKYTLDAVNLAIAARGNEAAGRQLPPGGGAMPDYMWLDTGQRPEI